MPLSRPMIDQVTSTLQGNPHLNGRQIRFEEAEGRLVIRGTVTSYFLKQMAQEAVRNVAGDCGIENQLEVSHA